MYLIRMPTRPLTISVIAKQANVGIETIRYYQRIGLIEQPEKPDTGYRIYSQDVVSRLRFIQRAKQLGFSLSEISSLLALGDGKCKEAKQLAAAKMVMIKNKISDLQSIETALKELVEYCDENPVQHGCPMLNALSERQHE